MTLDIDRCCRRSLRLKGHDYSLPGSYFVTVCTHGRQRMLGEILDGAMILNEAGLIVRAVWEELPDHYPHVVLDSFVIMPNHVHGIVMLWDDPAIRAGFDARAGLKPAPTGNGTEPVYAGVKPAPSENRGHGLPEIVRGFKAFSSRRINELRDQRSTPVWQRNYYEHVIRNERTLNSIREYIEANPGQWLKDPDNPDAPR